MVDVGFDPDVVEVPQVGIYQSSEGKLPIKPVEVALTWAGQLITGKSLERFAVYVSLSSKNPVDSRVTLGINCIMHIWGGPQCAILIDCPNCILVTEALQMPNFTIRTT